jgi:hypothetical protein
MPYRENAKEKDPLYFVTLSYTKKEDDKSGGTDRTLFRWRRAKDSFRALKELMNEENIVSNQIWAQNVISANDFAEKELETE